MREANPHGYTAVYNRYLLSSKQLTEAEHDVAVRRANGVPHRLISEELEISVNESKKITERIMDKVIPSRSLHDNNFVRRTTEEVVAVLLGRKELILKTLSIAEVSWVLSFLSNANDTGATALLFSLTAKRK